MPLKITYGGYIMKISASFIPVALIYSLLLSFAAFAEDFTGKTIRLGVDPTFPPLEFKTSQGKLTGFGVEIAEALCNEMKANCVWVESNWDGMIPGLLTRKFDAIASSMTVTPAREKQIAFTDKISNAPTWLVAHKNLSLRPTASALKGKTVGVQQGSSQEAYANAIWRTEGVNVISYSSQMEVNEDLANGRLDASLMASLAATDFFNTPVGKNFTRQGEQLPYTPLLGEGDAIGLRKEDVALRDAFNKALQTIISNGTYKKINLRYFDYDIYGSDT